MSSPDDAVGNDSPRLSSSSSSSSLFFSLSSYSRFHSQYPNPTMSSNNPEHGSNSSKPPSSLFFSLKSYNRFLLSRSRRSQSSSSVDSIPSSPRESSSSVDSIPYSQLPYSPPFLCNKKLKIPCSLFKRCTVRNEKIVIFCCHTRFQKPDLSPSHLSTLTSRSHHPSLVKLLGASKSQDPDHIYMVYEDIPGATLMECLQNPTTPHSNWMWRMQVALDLAQGLEYIHSDCGMVHHMIKSSTVIVTEPDSNASICLFGAEDFRHGQIKGTIDNMAPEALTDKIISQKSDVYAFGVVILELVSGNGPGKWKENRVIYLAETAREAIWREGDEPEDEEIRRGRVMRFVDSRLHDAFPMETAESLIQLALNCVEHRPGLRPEMASVAEDIRRLFLDSKAWQKETEKSPTTAFSLSSLLCSKNKDTEGKLLHYPSLLY